MLSDTCKGGGTSEAYSGRVQMTWHCMAYLGHTTNVVEFWGRSFPTGDTGGSEAFRLSGKGEYGRGDRFAFNLAMNVVKYSGVAGTRADDSYVKINDSLAFSSDPMVLSSKAADQTVYYLRGDDHDSYPIGSVDYRRYYMHSVPTSEKLMLS